jgi:hypothetical protein
LSLHAGKRLPHNEAELCVKGKQTIVVSSLHQTDSGKLSFGGTRDHGLHQSRPALRFCESGSIVIGPTPAIAVLSSKQLLPINFPVLFCHHAKERGMREHRREHVDWNLDRGEVRRKFVLLGEGCKSFKADSCADIGVGLSGAADDKSLTFADVCFLVCREIECLLSLFVDGHFRYPLRNVGT